MTKIVRVYTDHKSPYAYCAMAPAYALEREYDIELDWYPYQLRIAGYLGSLDDRTDHQWRRVRYSYMDARRLANEQGLTLYGPKIIFNGYLSAAGMLFAKKNGYVRPYNDLVFERFWRRDFNVDSMEDVRGAIEAVGGDGAAFQAYAEGPGNDEHEACRVEAEEMGVFGVPMFVLDGELFWGGDRIQQLRTQLDRIGVARRAGA